MCKKQLLLIYNNLFTATLKHVKTTHININAYKISKNPTKEELLINIEHLSDILRPPEYGILYKYKFRETRYKL